MAKRTILILIYTLPVFSVISGCSDPEYRKTALRREGKVQYAFGCWQTRENRCEANLADIDQVIKKDRDRYERQYADMIEFIVRAERKEREQWPADLEATRKDVQRRIDGDPDNIPDTVGKMFY